jgi:tetrapyrrole methylase family protein / MazG family protein
MGSPAWMPLKKPRGVQPRLFSATIVSRNWQIVNHFIALGPVAGDNVNMNDKRADIQKLVSLVEKLRGEDGCPWDKEQTRETLKPMLIEEAYEVLDALDSEDPAELKEELGDLLFQVVFHAQIGQERGEFDLADVINRSHEKMIRRHPHIFGDADLRTSEDVLKNWEDIKAAEKGIQSSSVPESAKSLLDGIPPKLPALHRAYQITAKASRVGFDWSRLEEVLSKITEEISELKEAQSRSNPRKITEEVGDLLFAVVNVARFLRVDPETALARSNEKFDRRFRYVESAIKGQGRELKNATLVEMDALWEEAKTKEETP